MRVFYILFICVFWSAYVYLKFKANPAALKEWGILKQNFKPTFLFLLPFASVSIAGIGIYGYIAGANILNGHILYLLILYPLWGLIQQFLIAGLISGKLKALENPRFTKFQIILLTSLFFSLVHFPNAFLMFFTFIMQWVFTTAFLRWNNIWPLGLFHGWIATFLLFYIMGRDLWVELYVGF